MAERSIASRSPSLGRLVAADARLSVITTIEAVASHGKPGRSPKAPGSFIKTPLGWKRL